MGPDRIPGQVRGLHRLVGSFLGILLFGIVHHFGVSGYSLLLVVAACQFAAEFFVTRNYVLTVIATTPLALLMGDSLHQPFSTGFTDRTVEVVLSLVFGSLFLWAWRPTAERRHHYRLQIRCRKAMGSLLGALLVTPPSGAKEERSDLQYELLSEQLPGRRPPGHGPCCVGRPRRHPEGGLRHPGLLQHAQRRHAHLGAGR